LISCLIWTCKRRDEFRFRCSADGTERASAESDRLFFDVTVVVVGSLRLTFLDRNIVRLALIGVSPGRTNWPSTRLFVVFNNEERGGIGGGCSDGYDWSFIGGDTVIDGLLLVLVPFIRRRPTGGLRNFIWNGPDGRREEDEVLDGEDDFVEFTKIISRELYKN
jgi:hypothetical protein